jgi:hypothetical protein
MDPPPGDSDIFHEHIIIEIARLGGWSSFVPQNVTPGQRILLPSSFMVAYSFSKNKREENKSNRFLPFSLLSFFFVYPRTVHTGWLPVTGPIKINKTHGNRGAREVGTDTQGRVLHTQKYTI